MIEYASSYGNDWYVVPLELPVGSLTRSTRWWSPTASACAAAAADRRPHAAGRELEHVQLAHIGAGQRAAVSRRPTCSSCRRRSARSSSPPVEDVLFMRDEMANMAWAIERSLESPVEQPVPRTDIDDAARTALATRAGRRRASGLPRYLLSTTVPKHWIPLLPVQLREPPDKVVSRLRRGAVLQPDGSQEVHKAAGPHPQQGSAAADVR